ncbi:hypothetical protein PVAND_003703 [Polypedilum vanderplanki]|uniref:Wolframin-like protein n=1 Tax=Polypedilum vanderplanki TaxID=319348 RepID=A0A9J6BVY6_POLVA|nr:hypothetical protein PVAND_003703 [Polypedilum vanderplanki]
MANWLNGANNQDKSKQRKRWEIEDKKLLKNLRMKLADDGNSDCQFEAAKMLLDDTDDLDSSCQVQGINYLKKAASQGHEMALELLGACYRTRRGINSSNESEIKEFLSLTPAERTARHAAHELFNSLCNGNEYVTVEQLEKRMREIYKLQKKKKKHDDGRVYDNEEILDQEEIEEANISSSNKTSSSSFYIRKQRRLNHDESHISKENLLVAADNYSHGELPQVNNALTLSIPHPHALQHVPYFHRPFFHPAMFFSLLYHRFIKIFSSFPSDLFNKYQILFALLMYALLSTNTNLLISLPTVVYYISLFIMVVASFKMLKSKHEFIDFRIWSGLFLSYNENVYADNSENQFLRNNLKPYFWFFLAFAVNLMIYPLISDQWLPNSEITVVSLTLMFLTLVCFINTSSHSGLPDFITLMSFAVNIVAKYPDSVVSSKWRFLDLKIPEIPSFMIGSGIEFSMNCRGMLYIVIIIFMLILARRRNWHGIYQFLIPHCVTLAWMQISLINSQSATTFGLMRSCLGLAGIIFFLPAFGLATLFIPVFAAVEWISVKDSTNKLFITISTSLIAILGSCFMAISHRTGKYVTYVQILLCVCACFFLCTPYMKMNDENPYASYLQEAKVISNVDIEETTIDWKTFYKYCLESSDGNKINLQMRCRHLDGIKINWDGIVSDVEISQIRNWRKDFLERFLPDFISKHIICYFGEINKAECFNNENCEIKEFIENQKQCNLDKWNIYEYAITVNIQSKSSGLLNYNTKQDSKVVLKAHHIFGNFTTRLNSSDKIWFKGALKTFPSSSHNHEISDLLACKNDKHTRIEVNSIGCLQCLDKNLLPVTQNSMFNIDNQPLESLRRGFKYLLNSLFYPMITFK